MARGAVRITKGRRLQSTKTGRLQGSVKRGRSKGAKSLRKTGTANKGALKIFAASQQGKVGEQTRTLKKGGAVRGARAAARASFAKNR